MYFYMAWEIFATYKSFNVMVPLHFWDFPTEELDIWLHAYWLTTFYWFLTSLIQWVLDC